MICKFHTPKHRTLKAYQMIKLRKCTTSRKILVSTLSHSILNLPQRWWQLFNIMSMYGFFFVWHNSNMNFRIAERAYTAISMTCLFAMQWHLRVQWIFGLILAHAWSFDDIICCKWRGIWRGWRSLFWNYSTISKCKFFAQPLPIWTCRKMPL